MKVAFGMKAHSGWAALVVVGKDAGELLVIDRRRIELVEEEWARQPYHAAEDLNPDAARDVVKRGIEAARRKHIANVEWRIIAGWRTQGGLSYSRTNSSGSKAVER